MRLRFWGTRGSIATPGPGTVRYGGNTSCVEIQSDRGTRLVLDCGTGAARLGEHLLRAHDGGRKGHMLVGHTHWDHIQGLPFFAPFFKEGHEWSIYGPRGLGSSLRDALAGQMQHTYFPVSLGQLTAGIEYHDLVEGTLELDDIHVTAAYLNHPALTLGYRIFVDGVTIVYSTDHEPRSRLLALGKRVPAAGEDERHARFLEGADLVIHDAQYTAEEYEEKRGWGHSTVEYVVDTAKAVGARRVALFHHDPGRMDDDVDALLQLAWERVGGELEVIAASEGLELELDPPTLEHTPPAPALSALAPGPALRGQAVIVVGPDGELAQALSEVVEQEELRLIRVADLDRDLVVERARQERPAVIILEREDDRVFEIARGLRGPGVLEPGVHVVVVSHTEQPDDAVRGEAAGVTDWLYWPLSQIYLRSCLRTWAHRSAPGWTPAPIPPDEDQRLQALADSGWLELEDTSRLDRVARIAAALFDVPIALVTLLTETEQVFKVHHGLDVSSGPRDRSFCSYAVLGDDVMCIPDAHADPRFADNPYVTGEPHVRFYAGVAIRSEGHKVGTLCVLDQRPRELDERQLEALRDLGRLVERELIAELD